MLEILKHAFGLCGEHWHPNIFTFIISGLGFNQSLNYIRYKLNSYKLKTNAEDKSKSRGA